MKYIISLGGSLVSPAGGLDHKFLKKFRKLILERVEKGDKFCLVAGGGQTSRAYIEAIEKIIKPTDKELDWLGIYATRVNALLVKTMFGSLALDEIIENPAKAPKTQKPIIAAGGWKPGWSTDFVAVTLANAYKAKTIINLSNIDYVYDKDPKKHKDAKAIKKINWEDFRKIVGSKWSPRLSGPFDPIASRECQKNNLKAIIMNGEKIKNLEIFFEKGIFKGTVIE